jgi:hypothetical protein
MPERQVHSVIRRNRRQIDPEIETGRPVNHHGQDSSSRADQVDVSPSDVCGNEQSARGPRQGDPVRSRTCADRLMVDRVCQGSLRRLIIWLGYQIEPKSR